MVALATPFSGSALAKLVPHDSFQELKTDAKIIRDLEKHTEVNQRIISVYPEYDTHVWADEGSFLEGAENIEIPIGGHNTLFSNRTVINTLMESVDKVAAF